VVRGKCRECLTVVDPTQLTGVMKAVSPAGAPPSDAPSSTTAESWTGSPSPSPFAPNPERESWYEAAGIKAPEDSRAEAPRAEAAREKVPASEAITDPARLAVRPADYPLACVHFVQAAGYLLGGAPGRSFHGLSVALAQIIVGVFLLKEPVRGRVLVWLSIAHDLVAAVVAAVHQRSLPLACVLGAIAASKLMCVLTDRSQVRWGAAGLGAAGALALLLVPSLSQRDKPAEEAPVAGGLHRDEREGFSLRVPPGFDLYRGSKTLDEIGALPFHTKDVRLSFIERKRAFRGGLFTVRHTPGTPVSGLLPRFEPGDLPPRRDDSLVPPELQGLVTEGWLVLREGKGPTFVILAQAKDGRAAALFAVSQGSVAARKEHRLDLRKVAQGLSFP
jgi:hypothetical protein